MEKNPVSRNCPRCGAHIPKEAPQGLCPKCLLAGALTPIDAGGLPRSSPATPTLDEVAAAFPEMEIIGVIGQGGMGVVYKARQPRLDRIVALKILLPQLGSAPDFAERFLREARTLARLNHPNIVIVHDFGEAGGFFYLMMEYVNGVNLRQAMAAGRLAPEQALAVVPRICEALQYAHDEGVLHRDIKPENILIDTRSRVKIADFGIAKLVGQASSDFTLTQSGARLGTPSYMAPEQIENRGDVDHRADIYSLGVVFYEMLTGELPIGRFAAPSSKSAVDARVDEIVFRTLEKEREQRFQSAGEVKTRVETVAAGPAIPAPAASVAPAGKWSQKAVWSAVLVAVSVPLAFGLMTLVLVPLLGLESPNAGRRMPTGFRLGGIETVLLAAALFFSAIPGLVGTILGWMAMKDVRESRGELRGRGLAVFAALTWPLFAGFCLCLLAAVLLARLTPRIGWLPVVGGAVGFFVILTVTAVRRAWRWTRGTSTAVAEQPSPRPRRWRLLWVLVPALILFAPCVGLIWPYLAMRRERPVPELQIRQSSLKVVQRPTIKEVGGLKSLSVLLELNNPLNGKLEARSRFKGEDITALNDGRILQTNRPGIYQCDWLIIPSVFSAEIMEAACDAVAREWMDRPHPIEVNTDVSIFRISEGNDKSLEGTVRLSAAVIGDLPD